VGEGGVVVGLDLVDPERKGLAQRSQEGKPRTVRQLREEADHPEPRAVIERGVLEGLPPLHPVRDVLDVHLDAVARAGQHVAL